MGQDENVVWAKCAIVAAGGNKLQHWQYYGGTKNN